MHLCVKLFSCRIWITNYKPQIRSGILHLEAVNLFFSSFSPGYGPVASPAKEEKNASNKNDSPTKQSPPSESTHEMVDGRKMFESWLFDKLTFITAMELQVGMEVFYLSSNRLVYLCHLVLFPIRYNKMNILTTLTRDVQYEKIIEDASVSHLMQMYPYQSSEIVNRVLILIVKTDLFVIHYSGRSQKCCTVPTRKALDSQHLYQRHRSELLRTIFKHHQQFLPAHIGHLSPKFQASQCQPWTHVSQTVPAS